MILSSGFCLRRVTSFGQAPKVVTKKRAWLKKYSLNIPLFVVDGIFSPTSLGTVSTFEAVKVHYLWCVYYIYFAGDWTPAVRHGGRAGRLALRRGTCYQNVVGNAELKFEALWILRFASATADFQPMTLI